MFDYLDSNKDSAVSKEEFKEKRPFYGHYDEFLAKYWSIFDTDDSGTLNFEEYMYLTASLYDGLARLMIKVRKLKYSSVLDFFRDSMKWQWYP